MSPRGCVVCAFTFVGGSMELQTRSLPATRTWTSRGWRVGLSKGNLRSRVLACLLVSAQQVVLPHADLCTSSSVQQGLKTKRAVERCKIWGKQRFIHTRFCRMKRTACAQASCYRVFSCIVSIVGTSVIRHKKRDVVSPWDVSVGFHCIWSNASCCMETTLKNALLATHILRPACPLPFLLLRHIRPPI